VPFASDPSKKLISTHGPQNKNVASVFNFYQAGPPEYPEETDAYPIGISISDDQPNYPSKWFTFGKTNNPGFFTEQLFLFPRPHPSGATWPHGEPVGAMMPMWINQSRVWIGERPDADPPSIGFGATAPASGYYVRGSITWNTRPTVGSPIGWVCTETGSPGTWAALARLGSLGTATVDVTLANPTVLDDTLAGYGTIKLTGTLAGNVTVTVPSRDGWSTRIYDQTTHGAFNVTLSAATLPGVTVTTTMNTAQRFFLEDDGAHYNLRLES
jgi:hypothetical protein